MWFRDSLERFRTTSGISVRRCFRSLGIQGLGVGDRYTHIQICTHTHITVSYCLLLLLLLLFFILITTEEEAVGPAFLQTTVFSG